MTPLYHFTDTARLPWIVDSGQLRPGRNRIGGYPSPDFLWATSDPRGDGSASMERADGYRSGRVRQIRFTLERDKFFPWSEVLARHPSWTPDQVERLERVGRKMKSNSVDWWCRIEPLPLREIGEICWRSYTDNRWRPLPEPFRLATEGRPILAIQIGDRAFASQREELPDGRLTYLVLDARPEVLKTRGR
ncbi:hypothetical protein QWJ07_10900 [Frankia sp. RB7]|nr:hypothetical protein [Frankia sp. RB7]